MTKCYIATIVTGGTVNSYRYEEPGRRGNPPTGRSEDVSPARSQQRETARWEKSGDEYEEEVQTVTYRYDDKQVNLTCYILVLLIYYHLAY